MGSHTSIQQLMVLEPFQQKEKLVDILETKMWHHLQETCDMPQALFLTTSKFHLSKNGNDHEWNKNTIHHNCIDHHKDMKEL